MNRCFAIIAIVILTFNLQAQTPRTAADFTERGLERHASGEYDLAIADYSRAIELTSRIDVKHDKLTGNFSAPDESPAENLFRERVRVVDPRTARILVKRGISFFAKSDVDKAINDFDQAISISPSLAI